MDIRKLREKIPGWFYKYRYPIAIALVGIVLLLIPVKAENSVQEEVKPSESRQVDMSQELAQILAQIEGVGKVKVMLTIAAGETVIYQNDQDSNLGSGSSSIRQETVIITDADRNQQALITQVLPVKYQGAIVICQGADTASVKWAVVDAVSKATGLGANQISVLKMK